MRRTCIQAAECVYVCLLLSLSYARAPSSVCIFALNWKMRIGNLSQTTTEINRHTHTTHTAATSHWPKCFVSLCVPPMNISFVSCAIFRSLCDFLMNTSSFKWAMKNKNTHSHTHRKRNTEKNLITINKLSLFTGVLTDKHILCAWVFVGLFGDVAAVVVVAVFIVYIFRTHYYIK